MSFGEQIPDKTLLKQVLQKISRSGSGSQNNVGATVRGGEVTLTGTLQYEHERSSILRSTRGISGIRRLIDQMSVSPKKKNWA